MRHFPAITVCCLGWAILLAGVVAPLLGMLLAGLGSGPSSAGTLQLPPASSLLTMSLIVASVASGGAVILAILPGVLLGAARGWRLAVLRGLVLAPLLVPPQVYAYAWGLVEAPQARVRTGELVRGIRAGWISACWLWPIAALILAAGWQSAGRAVYQLARLDAGPLRAMWRGVLPAIRGHAVAACCLVFAIALIEYPIPHLTLVKVYATELLTLVDLGAPERQVMAMAVQVLAILLAVLVLAAWALRGMSAWQPLDPVEDGAGASPASRVGPWVVGGAGAVWLMSIAFPAALMLRNLRVAGAWRQGFELLQREWLVSTSVAIGAGAAGVLVAIATVLLGLAAAGTRSGWRTWTRGGAALSALGALMPPAALGIGFIVIFNRAWSVGHLDLYTETPVVWLLALVARYGAVVVLVAWMTVGRRGAASAEQAMTDGADRIGVLSSVLIPMAVPALAAGGIIVAVLSLSEVVITQLVGPVGYPSVALSLLAQMHYGRDDTVITTSLTLMGAGVLVTQICGWLLMRAGRG